MGTNVQSVISSEVAGNPLLSSFFVRLATLRKKRGMTQHVLAEAAGINVSHVRRYEGGTSQPSLDVIRRLAIALSVSADTLLFGPEDRGPSDDLRLQFEAVAQFDPEACKVAKAVLDGLILQHQARRLASGE